MDSFEQQIYFEQPTKVKLSMKDSISITYYNPVSIFVIKKNYIGKNTWNIAVRHEPHLIISKYFLPQEDEVPKKTGIVAKFKQMCRDYWYILVTKFNKQIYFPQKQTWENQKYI